MARYGFMGLLQRAGTAVYNMTEKSLQCRERPGFHLRPGYADHLGLYLSPEKSIFFLFDILDFTPKYYLCSGCLLNTKRL